jgi:hypothetical protein
MSSTTQSAPSVLAWLEHDEATPEELHLEALVRAVRRLFVALRSRG